MPSDGWVLVQQARLHELVGGGAGGFRADLTQRADGPSADVLPCVGAQQAHERGDSRRGDLAADSVRFESWDPDLRVYCERVAGGVDCLV